MKTKFFTCFLALAASVGTMLASVTIDGIAYNLNETDLTAEVGLNIHSSGDIVIPSSVTYDSMTYSVTSIGYQAFGWCSGLTSIEISNSVTSIGSEAFYGCIGLTSVTIPNSVTSIGEQAFYRCSGLTSVTIPNSVTSIGESAFSEVLNIVYNGTATGSPWGAKYVNYFVDGWLLYSDNTKTTLLACSDAAIGEINIPSGVTRIGERAFAGCSGISSIYIPSGVSHIGYHAFAGCSSLATISIPSSVKNLTPSDSDYWIIYDKEDALFDDDNSLSDPIYNHHTFFYLPKNYAGEYTIPQCVKYVATAITDCPNLTAIHIPEGVKIINGRNFSGCPNLNEITLPNSITRILNVEGKPFYGSGYYSNENNWTTENGVKSLYIGTCLIDVKDFGTQTNWSIKEGTTVIADGTGRDLGNRRRQINSVTLPESLITIGNGVFGGMKLKSVTIPDNVRYIGEDAFGYNDSLKSVIIGDGVEKIGPFAFDECSNLKTIVLGSGLKRIGPGFIWGCSSLSTIICKATEVPELFTEKRSEELGGGYLEIMSASDFDKDFRGVSRQVSLYVPAEVIQDYQNHPVWGQFNVKPIHNADSASVDHLTLTETDDCSVRVEWPAVSNAETYELVITDQNGNVVCTYIFDSGGQLISIVFNAPNRDNSADQTQSTGFSFTITGLEEGDTYYLTITAKNEDNVILDTQEISYTITGVSHEGFDQITNDQLPITTKFLHNGQILILRGDRIYTVTGQELK